jgi:hypothetical protein
MRDPHVIPNLAPGTEPDSCPTPVPAPRRPVQRARTLRCRSPLPIKAIAPCRAALLTPNPSSEPPPNPSSAAAREPPSAASPSPRRSSGAPQAGEEHLGVSCSCSRAPALRRTRSPPSAAGCRPPRRAVHRCRRLRVCPSTIDRSLVSQASLWRKPCRKPSL